ncbi:hypothetical protein ABZ299_29555 [Streptomyces sp. NPDC006184]|uniref:hypothetical protein n=1 Tax=Streptomyces sp. NPDC006184 TaxID=3155455 RepID=UPI0033AAB9C4
MALARAAEADCARRAVTDGEGTTAGAPVPDFLAEGWASAKPVAALAPWLTTVVDDGTRALLGSAIADAPTSGAVLTAMRIALTHKPDVSPFGAVPELVPIDRGLEFAAGTGVGGEAPGGRLPAVPAARGRGVDRGARAGSCRWPVTDQEPAGLRREEMFTRTRSVQTRS